MEGSVKNIAWCNKFEEISKKAAKLQTLLEKRFKKY